jgi:hypothetical protein
MFKDIEQKILLSQGGSIADNLVHVNNACSCDHIQQRVPAVQPVATHGWNLEIFTKK